MFDAENFFQFADADKFLGDVLSEPNKVVSNSQLRDMISYKTYLPAIYRTERTFVTDKT